MDLTKYSEKNWENDIVDSKIPEICKEKKCVLGVDEAGRGPVLGPMVYGVCYCPLEKQEDLKNLGAADSKTLTEEQREKLFTLIDENNDYIGWSLEVISPSYISNCMYKRNKVSLNDVSHNSAIGLIKRVVSAGVNLAEVYVDTVGPPEKYEAKLQAIFPDIKITVSKKADSIYPIVSGASICAKVARDRALKEWKFPEGIDVSAWGSGYPNDPVTKNFLINSLDPMFGFPSLVRFSWSTAEKIIEEKCVNVLWRDDDDDETKENVPSVLDFFVRKSSSNSTSEPLKKKKRNNFFVSRALKNTECL